MTNNTEYVGKKVTVTKTDGDEIVGTVEAISEIGVVIKARNSSRSALIESKEIASIAELSSGPKKLKARSLPRVNDGKNRLHLIERHGYAVAEIEKMSEEQAKTFHDSIDHAPLGHFHREDTEVDEAIAEAEADDEA